MKKTFYSNYRVVVDVDEPWILSEKTEEEKRKLFQRDADDVKAQIERYVDGINNISVVWDTDETCSYCGYNWEVNEDENDKDYKLGQPVCCDKAMDEWDRENTQ